MAPFLGRSMMAPLWLFPASMLFSFFVFSEQRITISKLEDGSFSSEPLPLATLADLKLSSGAKLLPSFSPKVFSYEVHLDRGVSEIRVNTVLPQTQADSKHEIYVDSIPLKNGFESPPLRMVGNGNMSMYNVLVAVAGYQSSVYHLCLIFQEGDNSWGGGFGSKFLMALAILLIACVIAFLCYALILCLRSDTLFSFWPLRLMKKKESDEYTPLRTSDVLHGEIGASTSHS